jgi:hypothetical protein
MTTPTIRAKLQRLVQAYDEHGGRWPEHYVLYDAATVDLGWLQITAQPGMSEGSPVWLVKFNRSWGSKSSKSPTIFTSEWEPDLSIWGDQRWNPRQRTRQIPVAVLADVEAWLLGRTVGKVETPKSGDTLAVLAAFQHSDSMSEAVADAFRALALLKSDEPLTPDRLFRIADELDP